MKSLRQEGETNFLSGVQTAVMLYNSSVHTSLGVTPHRLKFGHEVPGPVDIVLGRPPLAPKTAQGSLLTSCEEKCRP